MTDLRKAARGAPCFLRLKGCEPGPDNERVVLCHRNGAGMALKSDDLDAVCGCFSCHARLDGPAGDLPAPYEEVFDVAKQLTHRYWRRKGLI